MISRRVGAALLLTIAALFLLAAFLVHRIPQPISYHNFADHRAWLGLPNFGDVASNLPFAVFGLWGMFFVLRSNNRQTFIDSRERWPYLILFIGLLLTAFGSAYYHLLPGNDRLMWDRLPMTIVFMALVSAMIAERLNLEWGLRLLPFLLVIGIASVLQWHYSELAGESDLRFYAAVQLFAVLSLPVLLLTPPRYTRTMDLVLVAASYVLAKIFETFDRSIFSALKFVSGHSLKHLAAGAASFWILRMMQKRAPA